MVRYSAEVLSLLISISILVTIDGGKYSGHKYPYSGGLSRGGHHSGGLSSGNPAASGLFTGGFGGGSNLSSGASSESASSYNTSHQHYNPPQQVKYAAVHGGPEVLYPVYHGTLPTYVYQYKDSGSKYGTLLAGLALYNLGVLEGTAYGRYTYKLRPAEVCKFAVKKDNGDYEETKINCKIISSFIFEEQGKVQAGGTNSTVVTTVANVTTVNDNGVPRPVPTSIAFKYTMFPNGRVVLENNTSSNSMVNGSAVTSVWNIMTSVSNALDVKGSPIAVTPGMQCFLIWTTPSTNRRKSIPCSVLQSYAAQSLRRNSSDTK